MKPPVSAWTHAVLFGALWGAVEATAGVALKAARLPFAGLLLAAAGLVCAVTLRRLEPVAGVVLAAGAVAAFLRAAAAGGAYPGPVAAVLLEAALVEAAFLVASGPVAAAVAGAAAFAAGPLQLVITLRLVAGREGVAALADAVRRLAPGAGVSYGPGVALAVAAGVAGCAGAWTGLAAWRIAGRVLVRLGRPA